ncbi:sporulation histidine kinase inhibitor Sda [Peribacillus sp. NPDC096540]|uniref:sporulation histidine kinase inhibitor Sda n=1 Tax=Peribacillus sp. NPDC096540 TaxID=3390612 RepID=UPI003D0623E2
MLQKLSDEYTYLKAIKFEIDPSFISLLTKEINERFSSDVIKSLNFLELSWKYTIPKPTDRLCK